LPASRNFSGADILQVPYDSGRRNSRMGNGPAHLTSKLADLNSLSTDTITVEERAFELGTTFAILRTISAKVKDSVERHHLPIVLAGGCLSTLGALSAIGAESTGVIWFDAHADFNTPETTPSGFIDGMALAANTGRCWRTLSASVPGFRTLQEKNVVLVGARDIDPEEQAQLESSEIRWLKTTAVRQNGVENSFKPLLASLPQRVYIHLDLDVLDVTEAHVNEYSCPGGLRLSEVLEIVDLIGRDRAIVGAAVTSYDPSVDHDAKALNAGVAAVKQLLSAACIDVS
jgi:arginase